MEQYNIAEALARMAEAQPFKPAIIFPAGRDKTGRALYTQYSFFQLNTICDGYAHGFKTFGIQKGNRTLVMVRPGIDLIAVTFALLKVGAVPILIDPGMGRKAFLQCVAETEPTALVGIPLAHIIKKVFPKPFSTITHLVTLGKRLFWGGVTLNQIQVDNPEPFEIASTTTEDEAAVAFTSGGTGIPKGVVYLHGMFKAQIESMQNEMGVEQGEIHLAVMYIFALFNPALGVTTVIPDMDPRKTAQLNPAYLVEAIQTHGVTMSLGSPLIWRMLGEYCLKKKETLPSLKHVFMFGAPVWPEVIDRFSKAMPNGKVYTPYGATEALPLTLIDGKEILTQTAHKTLKGEGVCLGQPIKGIAIEIIRQSSEPIEKLDDATILNPAQIGEIIVKGDVVTRQYLNRPHQTAMAKISSKDGIWHRMGDIGFKDDHGRVWILSRSSHQVVTKDCVMWPFQCEVVFNQHPGVYRSALVGIGEQGQQTPILILEMLPGETPQNESEKQKIIAELNKLGGQCEHTRSITNFLFHKGFPVDVRHNTKIDRSKLSLWAQEKNK